MSLLCGIRRWRYLPLFGALLGCSGGVKEGGSDEARRATSQSLDSAPSTLAFDLSIDGRPVSLGLRRIGAPVAGTYEVHRLQPDGQVIRQSASVPDCLYEGSVFDETGRAIEGAYASVSTCLHTAGHPAASTLHGLVSVSGRLWTLSPVAGGDAADGIPHRLIATSDLRAARDAGQEPAWRRTLVRRSEQDFPHTLPFAEGTPYETKYIELFVVNDVARVGELGGASSAEADTVALAAELNSIFSGAALEPRVRVVLVGQMTFSEDPYMIDTTAGANADELIDIYNLWAEGAALPHHDLSALLSGHEFQGSTIGLAYYASVCLTGYRGLLVQTTTDLTALPAETAAHEIGHTLNMGHDGEDNTCAPTGFLMAATAEPSGLANPTFSTCSLQEYQDFVRGPLPPPCIDDVPITVAIDLCGDGVISGDEACDCGTSDCSEIDPCCDGSTCQFAPGAECSSFHDPTACCTECQIAPRGTVCRPARDDCDAAEECSGVTLECPADTWPPGGAECTAEDGEGGACFGGSCVTRGDQCRDLAFEYEAPLTAPPESCVSMGGDSVCGSALCGDEESAEQCWIIAEPTADGITCGEDLRCQGGLCVDVAELDECPDDDAKTHPGACGCGAADTDTDGDGTADCLDLCSEDPDKVLPGECGCGSPDADSDGDGAVDCVDACPDDPAKTDEEACGCGQPETDTDGDGTPDCVDECPEDSNKAEAGVCGCGRADEDTNGDGTPDCPSPSDPGSGGCGCRIQPAPSGAGWWTVGLLLPLWARRRRRAA